jgi:anti-sigma B factor antagonist
MDLSVRVDDVEGWAVARVAGDVDVATAPRLRERLVALVAEGRTHLVVDLEEVDLLDSTGLGVLVGVLKRARTMGGDLRLVCTRPAIRKVFEITALDRTMPLADTVEAAVRGATAGEG